MAKFKAPKGMSDLLPEEMAIQQWMIDKIRTVFRRYGIKELEPTFIEEFATLAAKSGPDVKDEIYYFKDKAGRELGLRFDLTCGLCRIVASNVHWPLPLRLATISCAWRYDQPAYGRKRWFYQWDVEIIGTEDPITDAESIAIGIDVFRAFNYSNFVVKIGNRAIVQKLLHLLGITEQEQLEGALRSIDKIPKLTVEQIYDEFGKYDIKPDLVDEIRKSLTAGGIEVLEALEQKFADNSGILAGVTELKKCWDYLGDLGKQKFCEIDLTVVRGIGYYTSIVFEAFDKSPNEPGSLFGGGRYDRLIGLYGDKDIPGTGLAGGFLRLKMALETHGLIPEEARAGYVPKVYVVPVKQAQLPKCLEITDMLREAGIDTIYDLLGRKVGKNLSFASEEGIRFVVIVGPREVDEGKVTLRNMKEEKETTVPVDELVKEILKA
ncbi:MAG: histidine--tRNA ligase [Candidatus Hodarchaeota archaeon]